MLKDVVGYEDLFSVSEGGRLWSKRTNKWLKQHISKTGYRIVASRIGGRTGKAICFKIHRLVADAFIPNPNRKPFVNHKDGNKVNNHVSNLEWCTQSENVKHAYDTGLIEAKRGLEHHGAGLTEAQVRYIRANPDEPSRKLAKQFSVTHTTVLRCREYVTYTDVK